MEQLDLLRTLADGEFHSGELLAQRMGVSRTAIWKQLGRLEELGLSLEAVRGRGYRIPGGLDLLGEGALRAGLDDRASMLIDELLLLQSVDSTNAEIMRRAPGVSGRAQVCSAEQQLAGRGRRGRDWSSPYGRNIYLSVGWQYAEGAAVVEGLSLAVGVAVARALTAAGLPAPQLKWPNDVLYGEQKVGGILIEIMGDAAGPCRVVVGIGLNVAMPGKNATDIGQPWTDLRSVGGAAVPSRNRMLAALLNELLPLLSEFAQTGFEPWRESWLAHDAHAGRKVVLQRKDRPVAGIARGVDERGALLLETASGIVAVAGGEVSLRAAP